MLRYVYSAQCCIDLQTKNDLSYFAFDLTADLTAQMFFIFV